MTIAHPRASYPHDAGKTSNTISNKRAAQMDLPATRKRTSRGLQDIGPSANVSDAMTRTASVGASWSRSSHAILETERERAKNDDSTLQHHYATGFLTPLRTIAVSHPDAITNNGVPTNPTGCQVLDVQAHGCTHRRCVAIAVIFW